MRSFARICAMLTSLLTLAFGAGFAGFVAAAHRQPTPPPQADGIVVLTGGPERVETGLRLLASGHAGVLLVSGVAHGAALADLLHRAGLADGPLATRITLGRVATTTFGNAAETAEWVRLHHLGTLIVVTAGFHMPRAMLEIGRESPGVTLYPVAVQPQDAGHPASFRMLAGEYVKLLAAWLGVSRVVHPAPPTVS